MFGDLNVGVLLSMILLSMIHILNLIWTEIFLCVFDEHLNFHSHVDHIIDKQNMLFMDL